MATPFGPQVACETFEEAGILWYDHIDAHDDLTHHQLLSLSHDRWLLPRRERRVIWCGRSACKRKSSAVAFQSSSALNTWHPQVFFS